MVTFYRVQHHLRVLKGPPPRWHLRPHSPVAFEKASPRKGFGLASCEELQVAGRPATRRYGSPMTRIFRALGVSGGSAQGEHVSADRSRRSERSRGRQRTEPFAARHRRCHCRSRSARHGAWGRTCPHRPPVAGSSDVLRRAHCDLRSLRLAAHECRPRQGRARGCVVSSGGWAACLVLHAQSADLRLVRRADSWCHPEQVAR